MPVPPARVCEDAGAPSGAWSSGGSALFSRLSSRRLKGCRVPSSVSPSSRRLPGVGLAVLRCRHVLVLVLRVHHHSGRYPLPARPPCPGHGPFPVPPCPFAGVPPYFRSSLTTPALVVPVCLACVARADPYREDPGPTGGSAFSHSPWACPGVPPQSLSPSSSDFYILLRGVAFCLFPVVVPISAPLQ